MASKEGGARLLCPALFCWTGEELFYHAKPIWELSRAELVQLAYGLRGGYLSGYRKEVFDLNEQYITEAEARAAKDFEANMDAQRMAFEFRQKFLAAEAEVEQLRKELKELQDAGSTNE